MFMCPLFQPIELCCRHFSIPLLHSRQARACNGHLPPPLVHTHHPSTAAGALCVRLDICTQSSRLCLRCIMAGDDPVKAILPFLQRADELQKHDPVVAYYCEPCCSFRPSRCIISHDDADVHFSRTSPRPKCLLSFDESCPCFQGLVLEGRLCDDSFYAVFSSIVQDSTSLKSTTANANPDFILSRAGRLYAMDKGLKIPSNDRSKQMNDLLLSLMGSLEQVRPFLQGCLVLAVVGNLVAVLPPVKEHLDTDPLLSSLPTPQTLCNASFTSFNHVYSRFQHPEAEPA